MTFLSPMLLWGMALGVIPIIIHLLNRRRFRRVEWAPMYYLRLTLQRNRRRIQLEELLLLLLRIALPVLLFFFLARPIPGPSGLEHWLGRAGRSSQVVLIDDSLSMGYAAGGSSAHQRAIQAAAALVAAVPQQDRCTILAASAPRQPVVHDVAGTRREELAAAAASVDLTATHAAWPVVLAGVDEVLRTCTYPTRQLTIVTDLRRSGWDRATGAVATRWNEEGVRVRVVDVGTAESANVALEALRPVDRTLLAGAPSAWVAVVRNDSARSLTGAKAILRVDEKPTELPLPEIAPRQTAQVPLSIRLPGAGPHVVSLELPDDELAGDNHRWVAAPVKDSLLIRLVDGEPSAEPFASEVDYLAASLSIGVEAAEAWRVEVVPDHDFLSQRLEPADVLVLANVSAPSAEQAERLGRLVRDGMGLMVFAGARLDVGLYNDLLYRAANPLLPYPFKAWLDEPIRGMLIEPVRPSPLERLLDLKTSALERVAVRQIMTLEEPRGEAPAAAGEVRVLARWNDPARSPAAAERVAGEGRVLLWTTTADRTGSEWPVEPSYVLAMREAVRGAARPTRLDHTAACGEPIRRVVRSSQQVSGARVDPPGGLEPVSLSTLPLPDPGDGQGPGAEIVIRDTRRAGVYRLAWEEGPLGAQSDIFAANPDVRESQLERLEAAELKSILEPLDVEVIAARGDSSELFSSGGREIWRDLAAALLVLLTVESVLATWVGRSR